MSGFALGQTTLLLFQIGATAGDSEMPEGRGTIPGHGPSPDLLRILSSGEDSNTTHPGEARMQILGRLNQHFCFAVPAANDVRRWEKWLLEKEVKILGKVDWPRGGKSVYFNDLDGNVGEVASRGVWEHY
jgi:catechol 2,3-dioxygenase-like lactoylglutathione lyase family enzyme